MFPIRNSLKQGDAVSLLHLNFALEYAIKRVQVNKNGLKLNGTHQLLFYADDVKLLQTQSHCDVEGVLAYRAVNTLDLGYRNLSFNIM